MKVVQCKNCKSYYDEVFEVCPHCGTEKTAKITEKQINKILLFVAMGAICLLFVSVIFNFSGAFKYIKSVKNEIKDEHSLASYGDNYFISSACFDSELELGSVKFIRAVDSQSELQLIMGKAEPIIAQNWLYTNKDKVYSDIAQICGTIDLLGTPAFDIEVRYFHTMALPNGLIVGIQDGDGNDIKAGDKVEKIILYIISEGNEDPEEGLEDFLRKSAGDSIDDIDEFIKANAKGTVEELSYQGLDFSITLLSTEVQDAGEEDNNQGEESDETSEPDKNKEQNITDVDEKTNTDTEDVNSDENEEISEEGKDEELNKDKTSNKDNTEKNSKEDSKKSNDNGNNDEEESLEEGTEIVLPEVTGLEPAACVYLTYFINKNLNEKCELAISYETLEEKEFESALDEGKMIIKINPVSISEKQMPNVIGLDYAYAIDILSGYGINDVKIVQDRRVKGQTNCVTGTYPMMGRTLEKEVTLYVYSVDKED